MNNVLKIFLSLSLSGSLLILVLFLCKPILKDKLSKRWQYYIWLVVIARLLVPFAPETNLVGSVFQSIEDAVVQTSIASIPQIDVPIPNSDESNHQNTTSEVITSPSNQSVRNIATLLVNNLWLIWLIVACMLIIRKITIYQSFVHYVRVGRTGVTDTMLLDRMAFIGEQSGVKRAVELCVNPLISSPLLIGFFRPYIVLPSTDISETDFRYTVLHELTHYRRRDMFYKWLVQLTVCLHWFNPLVYLMGREINKACEFSCDETIIGRLDYNGAQEYGNTLLNAMATVGKYKEILASVTLSQNKKLLKERLAVIMKFKNPSRIMRISTAFLTVAIIFGATFTGAYAASPNRTASTEKQKEIGTVVFNLNSNGQNSILHSSSFEAQANQRLVLDIQSSITDGTIDFFLFSPNGKEQRITIGGSDKTETIALTAGRWAYNCTGFFKGGAVTIKGQLSTLTAPRPGVADNKSIPTDYVISVDSENIIVKQSGTEFKVEVDPTSQNSYTIRDNTNVPIEERNYRFNKWDIVVERKRELGTSAVFSKTVTLTIPEDIERPELYVQTTSGDIHIENLHNVKLTVANESGNIFATDTSTDDISAKTENGNIKLVNVTSTGDIELSSEKGSVLAQLGDSDSQYSVKINTEIRSSITINGKIYSGGDYSVGGGGKQTITLNGENNTIFSLSNIRLFNNGTINSLSKEKGEKPTQEASSYWTAKEFISFMQEQEKSYKKMLKSGDITQVEYSIYISTDRAILKSIQNGNKVSKSATGSVDQWGTIPPNMSTQEKKEALPKSYNGGGAGGLTEKIKSEIREAINNVYQEYNFYGLNYDMQSDRLYYNNDLVRFFEDKTLGRYFGDYKDGNVDVNAVRDSSGKLVKLESIDIKE